jgi:YfiH family protein
MAGVKHGFFGRKGGVSAGIYDSLNCGPGSNDVPEAVRENRARVARTLGAQHLLSLYQVHGIDVITVREPWENGASRPRCDAMVTDRPGLALGTLAADCGPILFADPERGVVGAAHAGWKGALAGVVEATVAAMERLGAKRERIRAALGPTIAQASYEVGPEFPAPFLAEHRDNARFLAPGGKPGKHMFDLPGYILARLERLGIATESIGHDTLARRDDYFSYRRTTLAGGGDYGRNVSAIVLER